MNFECVKCGLKGNMTKHKIRKHFREHEEMQNA